MAGTAVSLPQRRTGDYQVSSDLILFAFDGGALGVRISPAHPPVVSSVMSCAKERGNRGDVRGVQRAPDEAGRRR